MESETSSTLAQEHSGIKAVSFNNDDDVVDNFDVNLVIDNDNIDVIAKINEINTNLSKIVDVSDNLSSDNKFTENSSIDSGNSSGINGSLVNGGEKGDHENDVGDPDEESQRKMVGIAQDEVSGTGSMVDSSGLAVAEVSGEGVDEGENEIGSGQVEGSYDDQKAILKVKVLDEEVEKEGEEEWGDAVEGPKVETPKGDKGEVGVVESSEVGSAMPMVEENADALVSASERKFVKDTTYADVVVSGSVASGDREDMKESEVGVGNEETLVVETASADSIATTIGVKFTDMGDAVVGSINVDAAEAVRSGTAVVEGPMVDTPNNGDECEKEEPKLETLKGDGDGDGDGEEGPKEDMKESEVGVGNEETLAVETASTDSVSTTVGVKFTDMGNAVVDSINVDAAEAVRSGTAVVEGPKVDTPNDGDEREKEEPKVETLKGDGDGDEGPKVEEPKGGECEGEERTVESSEVFSDSVKVEENDDLSASASEGEYFKDSTSSNDALSGGAATAEDRKVTKESEVGGVNVETPDVETASVDSTASANVGVKFTDDGDAVVDSINVDAAEAVRLGTAIVGDLKEVKGSGDDLDSSAVDSAAQVVENSVVNGPALKDSKRIEADEVKSVVEGDSVVDSINVDVVKAVRSGVVSVGGSEVEGKEREGKEAPDDAAKTVILANDFAPLVATNSSEENQMNEAEVPQHVESVEQQNVEEKKLKADLQSKQQEPTVKLQPVSVGEMKSRSYANALLGRLDAAASDEKHQHEMIEPTDIPIPENGVHAEIEKEYGDDEGSSGGSSSNKIMEELNSHDRPEIVDGQVVLDSEDEGESGDEGEGNELFDSAALTAFLKAATSAGSDPGNIAITSQDGSHLFSVERPAGLGPSLRSVRPASGPTNSSFLIPSSAACPLEEDLSEEEKNKLQNIQQLKVKFLRLVQRVGFTAENSLATQVLYKLSLFGGRRSTIPVFSLENAKQTAVQLESEGKDALNLSLTILVLGKTGVGKSALINSIFLEEKVKINAFEPETTTVTEICGTVDGVKIRFIDVPGLKSSAMEQGFNRKVLESVKKFIKKNPIDIMFYVDRLDSQTRDLNDLPMLRTITASLGSSIWRNTVITLTHASSAPPDGPSGTPLSYEVFVAQRSHIVQQSIGQAVGDLRLMNLSMTSPISLVENHPACRKNREGQKVLPNGQAWRPQLLVVCYSMKILSEASSTTKSQDPIDSRKLFGFRVRSPPLPYLLSSLLQPRVHPKLPADQGGDNVDSDIDLDDLSDSDQEEELDEYDQLPPFKPLRKTQIAKLSNEQKKAYFEEYDYRVKLLQKKQWKEELKRMKEMKKGKSGVGAYAEISEDYDGGNGDGENGAPASVPVPLPDMVLPPSFDGDNPAYRYRFLEPTSQFLARPVLDAHGWEHDCGYDGVNVEQNLGIAGRFPVAVTAQVTKDKKDFNVHLDSTVAAKHGENGSSLVGLDIQTIGKQYAYIIKGESKFKNLKKNKTTAGVSVTFLGENVASGVKVEDQITLGKRLVLVGSTGTVRSQKDAAYGANLEVRLRDADYPVEQEQSSFTLSLMKWRGDLAVGGNLQSQISVGRNSKMAVRVALNNKQSGQITVKTSSSDHISLAIAGLLPIALSIYRKLKPGVSETYSIY